VGALRRIKDKALEISMSSNQSNSRSRSKNKKGNNQENLPKKPIKRSRERKVATNPMSPTSPIPLNDSSMLSSSNFNPPKLEIDQRYRMDKMRDIKSEIGDLMSKIDNASKQIHENFKHPLAQVNQTPSSLVQNEDMTTMIQQPTN
jgi:hypothetical protein